MNITQPMNRDEAREQAIDWQYWQSEQDLSYGELLDWQQHFESVAKAYDLTEEFKENGVI
jgi:hypothetical protein